MRLKLRPLSWSHRAITLLNVTWALDMYESSSRTASTVRALSFLVVMLPNRGFQI